MYRVRSLEILSFFKFLSWVCVPCPRFRLEFLSSLSQFLSWVSVWCPRFCLGFKLSKLHVGHVAGNLWPWFEPASSLGFCPGSDFVPVCNCVSD